LFLGKIIFNNQTQHFKSVPEYSAILSNLKPPVTFCLSRQTRLRLPLDSMDSHSNEWQTMVDGWHCFWKNHGQEVLETTRKAAVGGIITQFKALVTDTEVITFQRPSGLT
jgi:hypothetical protein